MKLRNAENIRNFATTMASAVAFFNGVGYSDWSHMWMAICGGAGLIANFWYIFKEHKARMTAIDEWYQDTFPAKRF